MLKLQQGDILINNIDKIPKGGSIKKDLIIAKGIGSGHSHKITFGKAQIKIIESVIYLKVISKYATLSHEEHKEINIPKGLYNIKKVMEYDHFTEESREVID